MTNGEKFKEIFPDIQIEDANMEVNVYINHCLVTFPKEWWNKTYYEIIYLQPQQVYSLKEDAE